MNKIITLVGTRPEIIRMSRIVPSLDSSFNQVLVHSGQNTNPNMKDVFLSELGMRRPDYEFSMNGKGLGGSLATLFFELQRIIEIEKPKAFVTLGDTNSGLALILFSRLGIPTYHLEAGNRSFDWNVPEELNRKIIDHSSAFNLVYTEHARRNLLSEGLHPRNIFLIGSPLREVIDYYRSEIENSQALDQYKLSARRYLLLSIHREENTKSIKNFTKLLNNVEFVAEQFDLKILFSLHPKTMDRIRANHIPLGPRFEPVAAMGFLDYVKLQQNAFIVLSDSGSISEESAILNFPAITLRESMERPEALESGVISMSSRESSSLMNIVNLAVHKNDKYEISDYHIKDTSFRVSNIISSTIDHYKDWFGLDS